ncbi:kisspeptin 2 [Kryptolebias marmoratus]|uniref:Kisspeptin 2 n=1 Tax=Kryptolebias marmoratus TaxID=37003 RepID=A0A3Q3AH51_KRYMA|nr:kisspeptin 2 [Kryptolebias marmoratus]
MRLVALVVVWVLVVGEDGGGVGGTTPGLGSAPKTRGTEPLLSVLRRRPGRDVLADESNLCFSLRENEDQRQLLCNDRRSQFNYNPFGLRFGKRHNSPPHRRAMKRARSRKFSPLSLFSRELEVPA